MRKNLETSIVKIRGSENLTRAVLQTLYVYDNEGNLVHEPSVEEKWELIRKIREELLEQSDWAENISNALTLDERIAWSEYRQKLRDIPQDYSSPEDVVIPEEPA